MNLSALKSRDFRLYIAGNLFALNAMWMLRIIVGWLAWDLTGSARFVGLVAFSYFLPTMFLGPFFGVLIDRSDVRRAAIIVQSLYLTAALSLWIVQYLKVLGAPHLLIYSIATGVIMSAHSPVRMSLAPRLVMSNGIPSAINFASIAYNISRMTGPAIGGWAIVQIGAGTATFVTALCYLPILLALSLLRIRQTGANHSTPDFLSDLVEGARFAFGNASIRAALALSAVASVFILGSLEILAVIADGVFAKGAAGLGLLTSSAGLGAIAAGVGLALLPPAFGSNRLQLAVATGMFGVACIAGLGLSASWPVAVILVAAMSAAASASGIICQSAIQIQVGDRMRGRVMSMWASVAIGSTAIGAAVLGSAAEFLGIGATLTLSAIAAGLLLASAGFVRCN
ncbi:MAG: MFS transporter [Albidovulum sp.]|nr:MFS transporter [Albidovulum sp.]